MKILEIEPCITGKRGSKGAGEEQIGLHAEKIKNRHGLTAKGIRRKEIIAVDLICYLVIFAMVAGIASTTVMSGGRKFQTLHLSATVMGI